LLEPHGPPGQLSRGRHPGSPLALPVRLTRRCCLAPANTGRFECRTVAS